MKPVYKVIKIFLIWRILLFIPIIFGSFLNYGSSYPFFEVGYYRQLPDFLNFPIFTTWSNFDGVHYLSIATNGYITEARFFPLLPVLILLLSVGNFLFPLTYILALVLPNIFFVLGLSIFYKLLRLDHSEKISFETITYVLIFPTAFFFVSVYTESLFLMLSVLSFYLARKGDWLGAVIAGSLLVFTRFVGIFIIPALIIEYFLQNKKFKIKNMLNVAGIIFITPLGLIFYSLFNYQKWGDFLYFLNAHGELGNSRSAESLIFPVQTIFRYMKIFSSFPVTQFEWWVALLELSAFLFGLTLLFIAWKKKIRTSYLIFALFVFLLPAFSGTFSGLPRYLIVAFPIFIVIALNQSKTVKLIYSVLSVVLLAILLMFFSRGYFIS